MEEDDRLKAAHEEETEYCFSSAEIIAFPNRKPYDWATDRPNGPHPTVVHRDEVALIRTASVVHDGTWEFEKEQLERRARQGQGKTLLHVTVWDRPGGLRGRYLDLRSGLWKWQRAFLRACEQLGRMVAGG